MRYALCGARGRADEDVAPSRNADDTGEHAGPGDLRIAQGSGERPRAEQDVLRERRLQADAMKVNSIARNSLLLGARHRPKRKRRPNWAGAAYAKRGKISLSESELELDLVRPIGGEEIVLVIRQDKSCAPQSGPATDEAGNLAVLGDAKEAGKVRLPPLDHVLVPGERVKPDAVEGADDTDMGRRVEPTARADSSNAVRPSRSQQRSSARSTKNTGRPSRQRDGAVIQEREVATVGMPAVRDEPKLEGTGVRIDEGEAIAEADVTVPVNDRSRDDGARRLGVGRRSPSDEACGHDEQDRGCNEKSAHYVSPFSIVL
jgi:hypothetical protein